MNMYLMPSSLYVLGGACRSSWLRPRPRLNETLRTRQLWPWRSPGRKRSGKWSSGWWKSSFSYKFPGICDSFHRKTFDLFLTVVYISDCTTTILVLLLLYCTNIVLIHVCFPAGGSEKDLLTVTSLTGGFCLLLWNVETTWDRSCSLPRCCSSSR